MKRLPKTLNVYGQKIPVKPVKGLSEQGVAGVFRYIENDILIDSKLNIKDKEETLLHELGHALINRISLNQVLGQEVEEIIVDNFAKTILENFTLENKSKK